MTDSAQTRDVVTKLFADVASGNLEGVLAALSPDIVFHLPGSDYNTVIPNLQEWHGKDAVAEAFRQRTLYADVTDFEQRKMIVEGPEAFVVNWQTLAHKSTGFTVEFEFSMNLTLDDDGLISHWKAYFDSSYEMALYSSDLEVRLLAAIVDGDVDLVGKLLHDGADPNHRGPDGLTALQVAAGLGQAAVVSVLIENGGDVFSTDRRSGGTALHKAVQRGDLETVRLLVEAGSFVDSVAATTGHTPLMDALWYKWPELAGYLLEQNAGINLSTHYGFSMRDHFEYELNANTLGKEKLLAAQEKLNRRIQSDQDQIQAQQLMKAVVDGDGEAVRALLGSGAAVDTRFPVVNGFNDAHTPLLVAAREGHTEIVRALLAAGADVNAVEPTFGASPLHKAVYNGRDDITGLLVAVDGVDLNFQGATNGYTPLHDAVWHGYLDCAQTLIDSGARLDLPGYDGKTPLDIAIDVFGPDHELSGRIREKAA